MAVEIRIAFQATTAPADTNGTWNSSIGEFADGATFNADLSDFNTGSPTGIGLIIDDDGSDTAFTDGFNAVPTGNAGWVDESIIAKEGVYFRFSPDQHFTGLDPAKTYTYQFFSSVNNADSTIVYVTIGGTQKSVTSSGNTSEIIEFTGLSPDVTGQLAIAYTTNDYGRINAVRLIEEVGGSSLAISAVNSGSAITDGQASITVSGTALDTVTSAFVETDDSAHQADVTASFSASSGTVATFDYSKSDGNVPMTTASYQLRLSLSDGTTTVTKNITVNPAAGYQVTELAGTLNLADPDSVFQPYTGPDPVVGEQFIVPLTTAGGGAITPNADSSLAYDYTDIDPIPSPDTHSAEYWSNNGTTEVWTSSTVTVSEPDTVSPTVTSVGVPAAGSYKAGDTLPLTVNADEVVNLVTTGGTPSIPVTIGATVRQATYVSGSGTEALVFSYTVQGGDNDADGITVGSAISPNGGTMKDSAGNDLVLALNNVADTSGLIVDTTGPVISINSITTTDTAPVVSGIAGDASSVTLDVEGVGTYTPTITDGLWSQQLPTLALGDYTMTLDGEDALGNPAVQRLATLSVVDEIVSGEAGLFRSLFMGLGNSPFANLFR